MIYDFGERRHGTDFDTVAAVIARSANSAYFLDSAQIDHSLRLLDSILQPVEAIESSGQHPRIGSVLFEKLLRVGDGSWLKQFERGHYVSYNSHNSPSNPYQIWAIKCGPSADAASAGPLRATSESCRRSPEHAEKSRLPMHPTGRSRSKRTHLQPEAHRRRGHRPASPGPEYPTQSIACRQVHRELSAACFGRTAWRASRRTADRKPISGRAHGPCRASNGRASDRRALGDGLLCRHHRRRGSRRCST